MEKNKNDEAHAWYNQAMKQSNQYILPVTVAAGILSALGLSSSGYLIKQENKIREELLKI